MEALVFKVIKMIIIADSGKNIVKTMLFVCLLMASNNKGIYFRMLHCASNAWHWYLCRRLEL